MLLQIVQTLKSTIIFFKYIDDIVFTSKTKETTNKIKEKLKNVFIHYDLKLNFIEISLNSEIKELKFLDVNHIMNKKEEVGFYVKTTAINSVYINGRFYHPRAVYKSIVFSESIRLRRLYERDNDYLEALNV